MLKFALHYSGYMDKQIRLLKYLKKNDADVEERNINTVLQSLRLDTENKIYDFLGALKKVGFIEWRDARPTKAWESASVFGRSPDTTAPIDYQAEITLPGLQYLREDELKIYNKWITIFAVVVAIITAFIGWYYSNAAKDKDEEISNLKQERTKALTLEGARSDSIRSLKLELAIINKSFSDHLKKDSISNAQKPIVAPVTRK